jgi:hypothetical protein
MQKVNVSCDNKFCSDKNKIKAFLWNNPKGENIFLKKLKKIFKNYRSLVFRECGGFELLLPYGEHPLHGNNDIVLKKQAL